MRFVETQQFTAQIQAVGSDEALRALQVFLAMNPEAGDLIAGTGGLRKVRMAMAGRGKRGSARVIYLYLPNRVCIVMFYLFTRGDSPNISDAGKAILRKAAADIKSSQHLIP